MKLVHVYVIDIQWDLSTILIAFHVHGELLKESNIHIHLIQDCFFQLTCNMYLDQYHCKCCK